MNQLKILSRIWKSCLAVLTAFVLTFSGLFLNLTAATASETPNMTVKMVANDDNDSPDAGWQHNLNTQGGHRVSFTVEIHNTVFGTEAQDVNVTVGMPSGVSNSLNIPVTVTTSNANTVSDSVTLNVNPASEIKFVHDSTRLYWDRDGDGEREFNNTPLIDGIADGGITLGSQKGCNDYIIQLTFAAELVEGQPQPTPTPTPTPAPAVNITNENNNTNTNNNNVNVSVNNTNSAPATQVVQPTVAGAKAPAKTPETGPGVLGMASMFGAAPFGVMLSRYGRGRLIGRREEELGEIASELVSKRSNKASA